MYFLLIIEVFSGDSAFSSIYGVVLTFHWQKQTRFTRHPSLQKPIAVYLTPLWASTAISVARTKVDIIRPRRLASLRVIRAYRSVSDDAALMLADMPAAFYGPTIG